jgi:hypothetical protein
MAVSFVEPEKLPYLKLPPNLLGRGRDDGWWIEALLERHDDHLKYIEWRKSADWGLYKINAKLKLLEDKWAWMSQHPVQNKNLKKRQVVEDAEEVEVDVEEQGSPPSRLKPAVELEDAPEKDEPEEAPKRLKVDNTGKTEFDKIRVAISDLGGAIKDIKDKKFVGVRMHIKEIERKVGMTNIPMSVTDRLAFIENALFHPDTGIQQAVTRHEGVNKQVCLCGLSWLMLWNGNDPTHFDRQEIRIWLYYLHQMKNISGNKLI